MAEKKRSDKTGDEKSKKRAKLPSALRLRKRKAEASSSNEEKKRRFHIFPKFLRNAWAEIKGVTWPGRKETIRLTFAVLIFSIVFGAFVSAMDFGLDKLFKEIILG